MLKRGWVYAVIVATAALAMSAEGMAASGWLKSSQRFKARAIDLIQKADNAGEDREQAGRQALNALNVAKMLLEKYNRPFPAEVSTEVDDILALQYWVKRKLLGESARQHDGDQSTQRRLASDGLGKAQKYLEEHPDRGTVIKARFFMVADMYPATPAGKIAAEGASSAGGGEVETTDPGPVQPLVSNALFVTALRKTLANGAATDNDKIIACERLLRKLGQDDPLRSEVLAVRGIFSAMAETSRETNAKRYFERFPRGQFANALAGLRQRAAAAAAPASIGDLVGELQTLNTKSQRVAACSAFLKKNPGTNEVEVLKKIYSAKYAEGENNGWLEYLTKYPSGAMAADGKRVLGNAENWLIVKLRAALTSNDFERAAAIAGIHKDVVPRSKARSEMRSLAGVLRASGSSRVRAASRHVTTYPQGRVTPAIKELIIRWKHDKTAGALSELVFNFAKAKGRQAKADACQQFLRMHPSAPAVAEVKAAKLMCSLSSVKSRIEAIRRYVVKYPKGSFVEAGHALKNEYQTEIDDESYRAAKRRFDDRDAPYLSRLEACQAYLTGFPQGLHAEEMARSAADLKNLIAQEKSAYDALVAGLPKVESLVKAVGMCDAFLGRHSAGPHAAEVQSKRASLKRQLGAQQEEAAYAELRKKIKTKGRSRIALADDCLRFLSRYPRGEHNGEISKELRRFASTSLGPHADSVKAVTFDNASSYLIACDASSSADMSGTWVWSLEDASLAKRWACRPSFTAASICAGDEDTVLVGEDGGGMSVWKFLEGSVDSRKRLGRATITAVASNPDGGVVVTASLGSNKARLWSLLDMDLSESFVCPGGISAADIDDDIIAVASSSGGVAVYRQGEAEPLWQVDDAHGGSIDAIAFSPGAATLATISKEEGQLKLWNGRSGDLEWEVDEDASSVTYVDSTTLATAAHLRGTSDGHIITELNGTGPVACSRDERFLAVGGEENMLTLWYLPALLD